MRSNEGCICLIGFQGAGKSSIGRWVATQLGLDFFDLDACLMAEHGKSSIQEVYAKLGETRFRLEEQRCAALIVHRSSYVIAYGGGAVEALHELPPGAHVVYLFRSITTLKSELSPPYPQWIDAADPLPSLQRRWEERHPLYLRRATAVIVVEKRSVEEDGQRVLNIVKVPYGE